MDWKEKREELANNMNPDNYWESGSDLQMEFADDIVNRFCKKMAQILCKGLKDESLTNDTVNKIVDHIFNSISYYEDVNWWCDRKNNNEYDLAFKLLEDYDEDKKIIRTLKKKYQPKKEQVQAKSNSQSTIIKPAVTPYTPVQEKQNQEYSYTLPNETKTTSMTIWNKSNKKSKLLIVCFFGWFGLHKFLNKKYLVGILYFLTVGLGGFGWIFDIIHTIITEK